MGRKASARECKCNMRLLRPILGWPPPPALAKRASAIHLNNCSAFSFLLLFFSFFFSFALYASGLAPNDESSCLLRNSNRLHLRPQLHFASSLVRRRRLALCLVVVI